jgi:hypothetical protein
MTGMKNKANFNGKQLGGCTGKGFMPGKSGNPKGRPVTRGLLVHLKSKLGELSEGQSAEEVIAQRLVQLAVSGDLAAIRECFDRMEGKPRQALDFTDLTRQMQGRTQEELLTFAETGKWPKESQ